jgi:signal transduction histidine kinase
MGEPLLIRRAVQNLLSNAIRYGDGGVIEAEIASREPGYVDLSISNQGPGIDPEHLPYVFDRFYRADSARTRSSEGSGLGLAIVKSIAALHHGEVRVSSTPNDRTTFVLRLPADQQHPPRTQRLGVQPA